MDAWLQRVWYGRSIWCWVLVPFSLLFAVVVAIRGYAFRLGILRSVRISKPLIVVGNISVGGTGKTPLVIWITNELAQRGYRPAVITRGYRGESTTWPMRVSADSDPRLAGDESVLIAQQTTAIVVAGPDRVADAREAIACGANVVVSDDGLQHYRLARDFEIAVVDSARGFGNGRLLPAGPLREPVSRINSVNALAVTCRGDAPERRDEMAHWNPILIRSSVGAARSLITNESRALSQFKGTRVHAVAGIGNPRAFFAGLRTHGLEVVEHPMRDHAALTAADIRFGDSAPVFMTEKDAVKCRAFADERCWVVPLMLDVEGASALLTKLDIVIHRALDDSAR
jgi:tetraacyldisaccharide 4'-kinase